MRLGGCDINKTKSIAIDTKEYDSFCKRNQFIEKLHKIPKAPESGSTQLWSLALIM